MKKFYNVIGKAFVYAAIVWIQIWMLNEYMPSIVYDSDILFYTIDHAVMILIGVEFYAIYYHDLATLRLKYLSLKIELRNKFEKKEKAA